MNERTLRIAIIGAGQRAMEGYCKHFQKFTPAPQFVAIAEPNPVFLQRAIAELNLDPAQVRAYATWEQCLAQETDLDAAVIGTPNYLHHGPAMVLLERNVPIVLEKPMATSAADCYDIHRLATQRDVPVQLGFVLRSTPFYRQIKAIVSSGVLGQILSIQADELVGRFVTSMMFRGGWRRFRRYSGGSMLEKCCHDLDLLNWLTESQPTLISSIGGRRLFIPNPQFAARCPDCVAKATCEYARDTGSEVDAHERRMRDYIGQADACIYNIDSDMYDHQSVQILYANGVIANFMLTFGTPGPRAGRNMHIVGARGRVWGNIDECTVYQHENSSGKTVEHKIVIDDSGHSGGDRTHAGAFLETVLGRRPRAAADTWDGYLSAAMCFAADQSVVEQRPVQLRYHGTDRVELV